MKLPFSWRSARSLAVLFIGLPMLLAVLYYTVLAHNRYVSTTVITVKRAGHDTANVNGLSMLLPGAAALSQEDIRLLRDYLHSLSLMKRIDARLHLRAHFESAQSDLFFRLWPGTSQEWMLEYWRSRVEITLDDLSGLLTLRTQGFEPAYAQKVNEALLQEAEAFINDISRRIADEQLGFAQRELKHAESQMSATQHDLVEFQTRHRMLDPTVDAHASGLRTSELRAQQARLEAELSTKQSFLNDDAPDIVTLKAQLSSIRQQVEKESRGATSGTAGSGDALNRLLVQFNDLKTRAGLAEGAYKSALAGVEATRIEASRKVKSVVVIEPPTQPEIAEYPRKLYDLLTMLVACLMLYGTVHLAIATIQEHRD